MRNTIFLNNDLEMPVLGLGTGGLSEEEAALAVSSALTAGYRLFDTAPSYKNEEAIGRALQKSSVPRKDLFITSKVWNTAQRLGDIEGALRRSLERLRLDYVDLYLIHWPVSGCFPGTWQAMERLMDMGLTLSIGVCNFSAADLQELSGVSAIRPAVNQIEVHPLCFPERLIEFCRKADIAVQASAPLAGGAILDHDVLCVLATKYAKTPAQISLRWALQKGLCILPRAAAPDHILADADLEGFTLEEEDMAILDELNEDLHTVQIPEDLRNQL